jgi:hypothetical protein
MFPKPKIRVRIGNLPLLSIERETRVALGPDSWISFAAISRQGFNDKRRGLDLLRARVA